MTTPKALILAAGRGERMRPLTDHRPKPLLPVRGKPMLQWPLEALVRGGFLDLVINTAWLGEQISDRYGAHFSLPVPADASRDGPAAPRVQARITYSHEGRDFGGALETAGGIVRVLPALGELFWVLAGDVFAPDFRFTRDAVTRFAASGKLAHLWLVPNPAHHPQGDFGLSADGLALDDARLRHTFSGIGLYRRALFAPPYCDIAVGNPRGARAPLAPILRAAMAHAQISAELYTGTWTDVGTPERLARLNTPPTEPPPTDT